MNHLDYLESESIYIIREAVASSDNPVMLYSLGKDSSVLLHLAKKAFYPENIPFPLLHIDTTWKFKEMYEFRDKISNENDINLFVYINKDGLKDGINPINYNSKTHTDIMKTQALKQALDFYKYDLSFGGARRDEEKSRAKERIFSFRNSSHYWDAKNQRPELWNLYNCQKKEGESIRVFPLSNWTELDVWQYIHKEKIDIVPLYFAKKRPVIFRQGSLIMVDDERLKIKQDEKIFLKNVRFRTLGCYPLTSPIFSDATTIEDIIVELQNSNYSERQGRLIDNDETGSMEKKKQEGYF